MMYSEFIEHSNFTEQYQSQIIPVKSGKSDGK